MLSELGMPSAFGRGVPANRLIQIWSPHTRWLSVPWMEPKKAPRWALRTSSLKASAVPYRFWFCQRL